MTSDVVEPLSSLVRKSVATAGLQRDDTGEHMRLIRRIKLEARKQGYSRGQIRRALQLNLEGYR